MADSSSTARNMFSMDESESGTHTLFVVCLYHSLFFFSVFRLLPILNDEYTLPPPAGKAEVFAVCSSATHGQDAGEHGDATVGVGVGEFSGDCLVCQGL